MIAIKPVSDLRNYNEVLQVESVTIRTGNRLASGERAGSKRRTDRQRLTKKLRTSKRSAELRRIQDFTD